MFVTMHYVGLSLDRSIKVCIGDTYSNPKKYTILCAQGSINSSVLFNSYCSTLKTVIPDDVSISGFADDHALLDYFKPSVKDAEQSCILKLEERLRKWETG